jgi:hypothetical protein
MQWMWRQNLGKMVWEVHKQVKPILCFQMLLNQFLWFGGCLLQQICHHSGPKSRKMWHISGLLSSTPFKGWVLSTYKHVYQGVLKLHIGSNLTASCDKNSSRHFKYLSVMNCCCFSICNQCKGVNLCSGLYLG